MKSLYILYCDLLYSFNIVFMGFIREVVVYSFS